MRLALPLGIGVATIAGAQLVNRGRYNTSRRRARRKGLELNMLECQGMYARVFV